MKNINNFDQFIESLNESNKSEKSIEKCSGFFNKAASAIKKKYFPDVKYYRDDKDCTKVHYALELFNNGTLTYDNLIKKISKSCKVSETEIHNIIKKFITDFGDYEFNVNESNKSELGQDFLDFVTADWIDDAANSHIEGWAERYVEYTSKKDVQFDLKVNHDLSIEIEDVEDELNRKLTYAERDYLESKFIKAVVKNIDLKKLRYNRGY